MIRLHVDETGRELLSVTADNKPGEYEVYYAAEFSVTNGADRAARRATQVKLTRDYGYDESAVLAKEHEEQFAARGARGRDRGPYPAAPGGPVNLSVFDVFKVGVGPSSSHTMGPMLAARFFVLDLEAKGLLEQTAEIFVQLYGSLALTGLGHCTDRAILLGLEGHDPSEFDPAVMEPTLARIRESGAHPARSAGARSPSTSR